MYEESQNKKKVSRIIQSHGKHINRSCYVTQHLTSQNTICNDSNNRVMQRLVGLEFESSNIKVYINKNNRWERAKSCYKTVIAKGKGFNITIDNGNMEIVTAPFSYKEGGQLREAVRTSVYAIKSLTPNAIISSTNEFPKTEKTFLNCKIIKSESIKAHPQVTMGIPLNALFSVYEMLKQETPTIKLLGKDVELHHFSLQEGKNGKWKPMGMHMENAIEYINKQEDLSYELKGLFAQVLTTINSIQDIDFIKKAKINSSHNVWKNQFVLMPRTKLSHLYNLLNESDREKFATWANKFNSNDTILGTITLSKWLKGIVGSEDIELATEDAQIESLGSNVLEQIKKKSLKSLLEQSLISMYDSIGNSATNINTKDHPINEGGIFEFRHLKGKVPLEEWPAVADEAICVAAWVDEIRNMPKFISSLFENTFLTECASVPPY